MTDELRAPDPGLRTRRREAGSSVIMHPSAPPPVADSYNPVLSATPMPTESDARAERVASDSSVMRGVGSMAVANLASRLTGFVRMILILAILGPAVASAFNTANLLPNMITELVLGSVLTAMFMPLLARSAREDPDGGVGFVRRLITVTAAVALGTTILAVILAPWLTELNLGDGEVNTSLATAFAFLLLPQILFYGLFSVLLAVLNYDGEFRAGAWAPVWNNLIAVATLALYAIVGRHIDPRAPVNILSPEILLLGLGTTLGVAVQVLVLVPALRRSGVDLRPQWGIDPRLRQFGGSALAGLVYVLISQAGLVVTNRIGAASDPGAVAIYQTHWLLLQVPYGIIGVTLLTAINPRLADNGTAGRTEAVVRDISLGTRLSLFGLVPVIVFMSAFGTQIATGLFAYGRFEASEAHILGLTLAGGGFTLIPYAIVLLQQRVFYAREDYWTPTIMILAVTVVRIILSYAVPQVVSERSHIVVGLALANGVGWLLGAVAGYLLLRRALGPLQGRAALTTAGWTLVASTLGCAVAWAIDAVLRFGAISDAFGSPGFVVRVALDAVIAFLVIGVVLWRSKLPEIEQFAPLVSKVAGRIRRS